MYLEIDKDVGDHEKRYGFEREIRGRAVEVGTFLLRLVVVWLIDDMMLGEHALRLGEDVEELYL